MENIVKKKKCPKCGMPLQREFCLHCGYMTNGYVIGEVEPKSISDVEMYLGDRYDKINRNKNSFLAFILGPLYFCYNKFFFFGLLCILIDILFCQLMLFIFYKYPSLTRFFSFCFLRIAYTSWANMIYLWLCKFKVRFIKKKYKDDYINVLRKGDNNTTSFIFVILALTIIATVFILILEGISNGIL